MHTPQFIHFLLLMNSWVVSSSWYCMNNRATHTHAFCHMHFYRVYTSHSISGIQAIHIFNLVENSILLNSLHSHECCISCRSTSLDHILDFCHTVLFSHSVWYVSRIHLSFYFYIYKVFICIFINVEHMFDDSVKYLFYMFTRHSCSLFNEVPTKSLVHFSFEFS